MTALLKALVGAGLVSSNELDDANASTEFAAKFATVTTERDTLKTERDGLKTKLDAKAKKYAEAVVASAIAEGRIEASAKDAWVTKITADDTAADLLASITPRKAYGANPAPVEKGQNQKAKTLTERCLEANSAKK